MEYIKRGYYSAIENLSSQYGGIRANAYIEKINSAIDILNEDINSFGGFNTDASQLKGDVAEFWHSDTFNINAALNDSKFKTIVDRSHDFASADITSNWGESFGLKYYRNAQASADAQATSYFERYCEYKATSGRSDLTFEDFLRERNINPDDVLKYDPIYSGQVRIVPKDQLEGAIAYLKMKIAKEADNRPEQVAKLQETLDKLEAKIKAPDGTQSVELSREEAEQIARLAKDGKFDAKEYGFSTEELIKLDHILKQGIKAGMTAAIISFVLKTAPEIYKCLEQLINEGQINEDQFQKLGFAALSGSSEGFVRGFISATLTTACESGIWGEALKSINPSIIAGLTVITMNMMKDTFFVVKGTMTRYEMTTNLSRNIFVTSCALGLGSLTQLCLPMIPGAYLLGNFVGSFVGSFAYVAVDKAIISFCIESGWTLFGLVKQDYRLPDEIIKQLGFDIYEVDEFDVDEYEIDEFTFDEYELDEYKPDFIQVLRRGVIRVHQIGYIVNN
jgi:hypothetical protein